MKIIIIVSSDNIKYDRGNNRVIYNSLEELNVQFDKVIIISARNIIDVVKGVVKIIINNPFSFDFLIFNALMSVKKSCNKFWLFFLYFAKIFKIKPALYWHEMPNHYEGYRNKPMSKKDVTIMERHLKNKNYLHLCVSKANSGIAFFFEDNPKIKIVFNCIPTREMFSNFRLDRFTVVTIGAIDTIKGVDIWTKVAIAVCNIDKKVQFVWCGGIIEKELYSSCIEAINKNSLQDRILFLGHVEDASIIASAAHLYFSSSRIDSMPLAVLEAMSFGKNVIHYDSGGIEEAVGEQGIRIENFDVAETKNKILEKIEDFEKDTNSIFNKELYDRFYENFTPTLFVNRLKKVLKENA
jgi:glycosyltransferase involved in cell wall biosynthesis